ncbi:MAG: DUF4118 domain-containing protein [Rhodospirillaceae bacterium]|nr:DUF4118 domain-containing protein [Rhodospirillaceae bacterium]
MDEPAPTARWRQRIAAYGIATLAVGLALVFAFALADVAGPTNVALVFLAPVMFCAARFGFWPAAWAALLSVAVKAYFFYAPIFSLAVAAPTNLWALIAFILVAGFTSLMTDEVRRQAAAARQAAAITKQLYAFSQRLAGVAKMDELLSAVTAQVHDMLGLQTTILMPGADGDLRLRAAYPPGARHTAADLDAARRVWDGAADSAAYVADERWLFVPLITGQGRVGVLGVADAAGAAGRTRLAPDEAKLLDALAGHAAVSVERTALAERVEEARLIKETEDFRMALLSSLTHDFKTPLASIQGAISSLRHFGAMYDDATRQEMLTGAEAEAVRLNRYISNLLDITRLDTGTLRKQLEPVDLSDVIGAALKQAEPHVLRHRVVTDVAPSLPMARLDFVLAQQALFNVIENAAKYAPAGGTITVSAGRRGEALELRVSDQGPGIPPEQIGRIFDRFYRIKSADRQRAGVGLGLAVAKGFAEAMGGTLAAGNRPEGGAQFTFTFPPAALA